MDNELKYPNQITHFTNKKNAKYDGDPEGDYVLAEHVNELQEAINRLEKTLGIHVPKNSSLTERIESLEGLEPMRVPSVGYFPFGLEGELTSVLSILSSYDLLLLGEGSNVESVINQTKSPTYGIVDATIDLSILQNQIAVWKSYGVKGIFLDNFEGFNTRAEEQEVVDSVAQEGLSIVFSSTDIDRKLDNQVIQGYNPLAKTLEFPKETIYVLKDFGYQPGFPAQDVLLSTTLPLINSLKDKNLKITGFSSADDAEKFHYTQALSLLFSLDYLYSGNSLGETVETRTPLFDWPTSLSNWRTNELRVFSDNSSIYRHIKNGVVRVYKDGRFELSGLEIPSDMIQWYENIIPGFAIKEASIAPGKLSTYDILKIIDLINNAPDEHRIDGTKIRTDGGGGFLPINIPASNMIQNVIEAINKKNNPPTQETMLIENYAIKNLDAEKITGNIRKEQLVNQVIQSINEASNEDVYINVPRIQVVNINSTGTSELNTVTGDNLTFRAGNITEALTVRDIKNTNFIEGNDGEFYKLYVKNLTVDTLSGLKDLHVENLTADNIGSLVLEAVEAQIETGVFNQIITHALTAENIQADLVTALNAVVDKQITNIGLFGDAVIKSAAIDTVSASKINSGVINTTLVDLASEDGHLRIEDNKLSIYDDLDVDGNRRLRVLLGNTEDVSGTFGLVVLGEDGETRLYDHTGVYNAGLHNNIISNEKIQDEAIDGRVIRAETIIGEHILGGTITGDLISAETITAFNILAETITAVELASDAIRARHILAGEIESGHISSGSIETKHIQAGAITAEQLAIGFNINLMKDGMDSFEQEELGVFRGIAFVGNSRGEIRNDWSYEGEKSLVISGNSTQNTVLLGSENYRYNISVRPGQEYFVSAFVRNETGGQTPVRIGLAYGTNTMDDASYQLSNLLEVEGKVSRIWTKLVVPEGIQRATVILSVDATNTEVWFDSIQVEEAEENQTAPGPWKTTATTRINADQIQTGRIGADFIQLGTGAVFGDNTIVEINDEGIKAKSEDGFAMLNNKGLEIQGGAFQLRSGTLGEKSFRIENSTLTAETPLNLIQIDPDKGFQIVSKQNNQILFDTDPETGEIRMAGTFKVYSKDNPDMSWNFEDELERISEFEDGKSAYQIAVENGYLGTEIEWLNSLEGKDGEKGDSGDPAVTYFIENMSTGIQRDVRTKQLTPSNFTISGRKRISDGPAVPFSGYFVVYEQVRESLPVDDFTKKVIQKDLEEDLVVVSNEPFPFLETYRSTSAESELDYTIKGDPLSIQVHWYIDASFSERIATQKVLVTDNGTIDYVSEEIERVQNTAGIQVGLKVGYSGFTTQNANSVYLCGTKYDYSTGKMQLVDEPGKIYIRHLGETHLVPNQALNTTGLPANTTAYIIYDHAKKSVYYIYFETKLSDEDIENKRWRDISGNTIRLNESLFAIGEVST